MLQMANNDKVKVLGISTIFLESNNGSKLVLNNVKHASDVRLNLIFVGNLDDEGYVNTLGAGQWKLTRGSMIVARGDKLSNLSYGGILYFVTFIDDHSRKLWVFPLKSKDQVLDVFRDFQALVKRQTEKKLKYIRSDNGGKYIGPFDRYCREQGPQTMRTHHCGDVDKVLTLLKDETRLRENPEYYTYVINLSPTVSLYGDVPDRVWFGKNVFSDYLRVFGCKSFVHVPNDKRSKLEVKTRQCIFIGYGQDEFGYHFYDPVEKKLVRSHDVVFFEDQSIDDFDKAEKYLPLDFATSNGLNRKCEMILKDEAERYWSVWLGRVGANFGITRGWTKFRTENGLHVGDAYKSELIKNGEIPIAHFHCYFQLILGNPPRLSGFGTSNATSAYTKLEKSDRMIFLRTKAWEPLDIETNKELMESTTMRINPIINNCSVLRNCDFNLSP
ncbi:putative acetylajmalan esterase-like [Capsicum annuum]|nr:putative acetylajmalan esterase-like [Capsicum annuum]